MIRRLIVAALAVALAVSVGATRSLASDPPAEPDGLRAYSIIPPGQNGFVGAFQVEGPHSEDQLDMYAALIDDDDVTEDELASYLHEDQFAPQATIEREYSPTAGVTVFRDSFGIPHIYADTDAAAEFALGYVTAEDRLWHMDVLRHAARGRLSEILGADFVEFDISVRTGGYSTAELQGLIDDLDHRWPDGTGAALQGALDDYAAGVNARIAEVRGGAAPLPIEYAAQGVELEDWSPIDTAALVIFQLRDFGTSQGGDLANAAVYQRLIDRLGNKLGNKVFDDIVRLNDPNAYPTVPSSEGLFPSRDLGKPDPDAVAIPDDASEIVGRIERVERARRRALKGLNLSSPSSNFVAVAPEESATGNALQWGAPQVGYSMPQFFLDVDVHSPTLDFRGPALPGASLLIPLGRGDDYAWSLTTGVSDEDDTVIERLCEPKGGKATKKSNGYRFKGDCKKMDARKETIAVAGGEAQKVKIFRTKHGPVLERSTVDSKPVAIVNRGAYWMRELDNIATFYKINSNTMDSVGDFSAALAGATVSFNAVYADDTDIAYFHIGRYPKRERGVDPMLPSWGTGKWEWDGFLDFSKHPQMVNPAQGWIANWNNKPAAGWDNSQSSFWGPAQRVRLLSDRMETLLAGGATATLSDVVDVVREASTIDARAAFIGEDMVALASGVDGTALDALTMVSDWIAGGAHRWDRDRDNNQDFSPAVAVFDTWYLELVHRVFDDELGKNTYSDLVLPVTDDAGVNNGSAYYADFSSLLWNVFDEAGAADYARDYCDDRDTTKKESCASQATKALEAAVADLSEQEGGADVSSWTWPADYIEFDAVGAGAAPPIPWQNRGTYNHAVEVLGLP